MRELPFYTNWSYAHPRAVELAAEVADLAPGDLNRVFFVSGGSEAVESAWKLARQYYLASGQKQIRSALATEPETRHDELVATMRTPPRRYKAIARHIAYHGTTFGALALNGIPGHPRSVRAARARGPARPQHEPLSPAAGGDRGGVHARSCSTTSSRRSWPWAPETVCLVHMEPVQSAGGCFTPPAGYFQGVREICDRYDILLSADEVITGFGRLGHWFGVRALRHQAGHRHVREGALVVLRGHRRGDRDRPGDGAVPRGHVDVLARDHLRRSSR